MQGAGRWREPLALFEEIRDVLARVDTQGVGIIDGAAGRLHSVDFAQGNDLLDMMAGVETDGARRDDRGRPAPGARGAGTPRAAPGVARGRAAQQLPGPGVVGVLEIASALVWYYEDQPLRIGAPLGAGAIARGWPVAQGTQDTFRAEHGFASGIGHSFPQVNRG